MAEPTPLQPEASVRLLLPLLQHPRAKAPVIIAWHVLEAFIKQRKLLTSRDGGPGQDSGDVLCAGFITRGADSGTHAAEKRFWRAAGIAPAGGWYRDIGGGMGAALNMAAAMDAHTLSDRGTWLSFRNRRDLTILVEGDRRLFNQYGVMLVNPARHPGVKAREGRAFVEWLVSAEGQATIAGYRIGGEPLFFPNAE